MKTLIEVDIFSLEWAVHILQYNNYDESMKFKHENKPFVLYMQNGKLIINMDELIGVGYYNGLEIPTDGWHRLMYLPKKKQSGFGLDNM